MRIIHRPLRKLLVRASLAKRGLRLPMGRRFFFGSMRVFSRPARLRGPSPSAGWASASAGGRRRRATSAATHPSDTAAAIGTNSRCEATASCSRPAKSPGKLGRRTEMTAATGLSARA